MVLQQSEDVEELREISSQSEKKFPSHVCNLNANKRLGSILFTIDPLPTYHGLITDSCCVDNHFLPIFGLNKVTVSLSSIPTTSFLADCTRD